MMDGRIFLAICAALSLGLFFNGLRLARMDSNPWTGKRLFGMEVSGSEKSVSEIRRLGWLQMVGSIAFLLLVSILCFGLLGPVDGIRTIGQ